ncbi:Scn11a [Symbiodinium necroappetens]|uniref:Scn11a protein n=1 Tax=Symbiodinium necroappetens TaxID=1628268 RepID=A0A812JBI4_9DINO|nr:Scn11a [Symbiodinium necroappetens]
MRRERHILRRAVPAHVQTSRVVERWWESRHDTVTEQPLPICNCSQPKLFSNKDSARCELNKFDDMMTVLHDSRH